MVRSRKTSFVPNIPAPGAQSWPFRLGDIVEDPYNPALKGLLVARTYHISGCDTFSIDLLGDPKNNAVLNKRVQYGWPGTRLQLVEAHPERYVNEIPPSGDGIPSLGDRVRDFMTGLEGRVLGLTSYLSQQSVQVSVQPPVNNEGAVPEASAIDMHMLEVIEAYKRPEGAPADPPGATGMRALTGRATA